MKLVTLSAEQPRAGKDTFCDMLKAALPDKTIRSIAYGDLLRTFVVDLFGGNVKCPYTRGELLQMLLNDAKDMASEDFAINKLAQYEDYRAFLMEKYKYCPREAARARSLRFHMQQFGNNYMKIHKKNPNMWINHVHTAINNWFMSGTVDLVIITDLRSVEEYQLSRKLFNTQSCLIKTNRPPSVAHCNFNHPVENQTKFMKFDQVFNNVWGDKAVLEQQAKWFSVELFN